MRFILSLFVVLFCTIASIGQDLTIYETFDDFKQELEQDDNKVHVINFWATWCGPCVKEMPFFEELAQKHDNVEVTFVSIDFMNQVDRRVKPFLEKKQLQSKVVLLGDPKANDWIDRVDPSWSGAIPATIVYKGKNRTFYEREFHSVSELEEIIHPFIK